MDAPMGGAPSRRVAKTTVVIRRRTVRRQQRRELIQELLMDIDNIETRLRFARTSQEAKAYQNLFDILYGAYCELVDSEV